MYDLVQLRIYTCVMYTTFFFSCPGVLSHSRVAGACPVTTGLIMRAMVATLRRRVIRNVLGIMKPLDGDQPETPTQGLLVPWWLSDSQRGTSSQRASTPEKTNINDTDVVDGTPRHNDTRAGRFVLCSNGLVLVVLLSDIDDGHGVRALCTLAK